MAKKLQTAGSCTRPKTLKDAKKTPKNTRKRQKTEHPGPSTAPDTSDDDEVFDEHDNDSDDEDEAVKRSEFIEKVTKHLNKEQESRT